MDIRHYPSMITFRNNEASFKKALSISTLMNYIPILAIAIIVFLTWLFITMVQNDRMEEQRDKLIEDALWVEQNLVFHLRIYESNLERIATELSSPALQSKHSAQLAHLKAINSEVVSISWVDLNGESLLTLPQGYRPDPIPPFAFPPVKVWLPVYYSTQHNDTLVKLSIPIFDKNNELSGALQATLSLSQLLTNHVPWWVAENYDVVLINNSDHVIAKRVNAAPTTDLLGHSMSVDPPLHGVRLRLTPYSSPQASTLTLLLSVIVALAALATVNLLVQHYYARKRQQAEQALLNEQAFRRAMENSITTGLRARDLHGRILYVNPAFCRLVGLNKDEIIGLTPPMPWWIPEMFSETLERHYQQNQTPKAQSFETRFMKSDGSLIDVQIYEAPLIDHLGKHMGWMGSIIDISSRKAQEEHANLQAEQLQHTAHLMTMGEMATTLAHELNQPLSAVTSYTTGCINLLKNNNIDTQELLIGLKHIAKQNRRAGEIIRRTHDFVRKREPVLRETKLQDILQSSLAIMQSELRKHKIHVTTYIPANAIYVMADHVMIEQVVLNLLRNAIDALRSIHDHTRLIELTVEHRDQHALVIISDNGYGVDENLVSLLFQPFASTKTQGMGIGLNICRSIIELHHGTLWYEATSNPGAVFVFTLALTNS